MIETDVGGERFYTIPEVARIVRVSDQSVRRWIKAGELRATKPGKEYRIRHSDLEEFLRAREPRPKAPSRSRFEPTFNDVLEEERLPRSREESAFVIVGRIVEGELRMVVLWNVAPEERDAYRSELRKILKGDYIEEELPAEAGALLAGTG